MGIMKHVTDYFFEKFGTFTVKSGDICTDVDDAAQLADFSEEDESKSQNVFALRLQLFDFATL